MLKNGGDVTARGIDMTDLQKSLVNMKSVGVGASFSGVKYSDIEVIPSSFLSMKSEKVISIQDQEKFFPLSAPASNSSRATNSAP